MDGQLAEITRELGVFQDGDIFGGGHARKNRFTIVARNVMDLGEESSSSDSEGEMMAKNGPEGALMNESLFRLSKNM